jgi:hypothetical protein
MGLVTDNVCRNFDSDPGFSNLIFIDALSSNCPFYRQFVQVAAIPQR